MSAQYANNMYENPEYEYTLEELQKKLKYSMANFAQERFRRAVKNQVADIRNL